MSNWTPHRLPIWVPPVPGEGLDSWLAAYAHRLRTTEQGLLEHLGIPDAQFATMVRTLTEAEEAALTRTTGVRAEELRTMTLAPWIGSAVNIDPGTRQLGPPPSWKGSARFTSFCPDCLGEDGGRWQLKWRLPWAFACVRHVKLLLEKCPRCNLRPALHKRRMTFSPGLCLRGHHDELCGFPLPTADAVTLKPESRVLWAQRIVDEQILGPGRGSSSVPLLGKETAVLGQRILRALRDHQASAPDLVLDILAECGGHLPAVPARGEGFGPTGTALGVTVATTVLTAGMTDYKDVFTWLQGATKTTDDQERYAVTWAHQLHRSGPNLFGRAIAAVDDQLSLQARLRYATLSTAPASRSVSEDELHVRASKIPGMLWPSWTMRILDHGPSDHRLAGFRRATASFLLLVDSPCRFPGASALLGNTLHKPNWDILHAVMDGRDLAPLLTTITYLARALDAHPVPIDYIRRRTLFGAGDVFFRQEAYRQHCKRHGTFLTDAQVERLRWQVQRLLLGAEPGGSSRSLRWHMDNGHLFDQHLKALLWEQAETNLQLHGIDEPVRWEPPADWLAAPDGHVPSPRAVDAEHLAALLLEGASTVDAAQSLGIGEDHLRLHLEAQGSAAPSVHKRAEGKSHQGKPLPRQGVLDPNELRRLYVDEGLSTPQIAELAGCAASTVGSALKEAGIRVRRRQGPLRAADGAEVTAEWLRREYVARGRQTVDIAEELDCHNAVISQLLKRFGIPARPLFAVSSPFTQLGVPLSPAMQAVIRQRNHVKRLRTLVQLPGQLNLVDAISTLEIPSSTLRHQLKEVERAVGFSLFAVLEPLTLSAEGTEFLAEARRLLGQLDELLATREAQRGVRDEAAGQDAASSARWWVVDVAAGNGGHDAGGRA